LDFTVIIDTVIRTPEVAANVSTVAAVPEVRKCVVAKQRELAADHNIAMEGRDIGSVVFPEAELKIFLTASVEERAKRRYKEQLAKGIEQSLEDIKKDIVRRDEADSTRAASPLKKMPDAVELDTTGLTIDQVVEKIVTLAKERM
jgi:cytidylate kinase